MNWVNNLSNKVLSKKEPKVIKHTFKGKATTDPFEISELRRGWQDGFDHAMKNWTEGGDDFVTFPPGCNKGFYGNGFAEGVFSGINKHLDRLYPGAKSLSYNPETKKYDVTY